MPNRKGAVPAATRDRNSRVKPEPPADMWATLDAEIAEYRRQPLIQPPNTFTRAEFNARTGRGVSVSDKLRQQMIRDGKMEHVRVGHKLYFRLTRKHDGQTGRPTGAADRS